MILQCHAELVPLLRQVKGLSEVLARGESLPGFDAYSTLLSLPRLFATTLETIPATIPYLSADPARSATWAARLGADRRFKIGIAWAGSAVHKDDQRRSMPLAALAPLSSIPGLLFVSLQKGPQAQQIQSQPTGLAIVDWTADLHDFADTAALIAHLDLVIAVDTAVVHLAGAMGKPVWTLLASVPDWRWLLNRSDTPWYPTMRLFRQPTRGDWTSVVDQIAQSLTNRK